MAEAPDVDTIRGEIVGVDFDGSSSDARTLVTVAVPQGTRVGHWWVDLTRVEGPTTPAASAVVVVFAGGPWDGQSHTMPRVVGPVLAVGHEVGNHYWLDTNSDPPTYVWDGTEFERAEGSTT